MSGPVDPLRSAEDVKKIDPYEQRLWAESRDFDDVLHKSGHIHDDTIATRYLQDVMDRLYPEFRGTIRVEIVKSPHLNAFALPNGSIYFHLGMLSRLENEAQLATVLGHEGAHFILKHGFQHRENVKNSTAFALVVAAAGIPIVGNVIAASSIYGFSRDHEREADQIGFERLIRAGYDPRESVRAFEHLAAEVKLEEINEPFFFSSHPNLQERIDSFRELIAKHPGEGRVGKKEFLAATGEAKIACLERDLSLNRFKSVILVLSNEKTRADYPPEATYYLAEAYRKRGEPNDVELSEKTHLETTERAPRFAPPYRALGIHYMKQRDYVRAESFFSRYLEMSPAAVDRSYVLQYYNDVKKELARK